MINPSSPLDVCAREVAPQRQTWDFVFEHEHGVKRKRKRRAAGQADESCQPNANTKFCTETKPHREIEVKPYVNHAIKSLHVEINRYMDCYSL